MHYRKKYVERHVILKDAETITWG